MIYLLTSVLSYLLFLNFSFTFAVFDIELPDQSIFQSAVIEAKTLNDLISSTLKEVSLSYPSYQSLLSKVIE